MRRLAAAIVGFALGTFLAGVSIGWFYVFILDSYDRKFTPQLAFELHVEIAAIMALGSGILIGIASLLLAWRQRWIVSRLRIGFGGAVVAGALYSSLHRLLLELAEHHYSSSTLALSWLGLVILPLAFLAVARERRRESA